MSLWDEYWDSVENEDYLAAKALLALDPDSPVRADAERFLRATTYEEPAYRHVTLDWEAWIADVDANARYWSSSEDLLFEVVAGLVDETRTFHFSRLRPGRVPAPEAEFWRILVEWGTGGNNADSPGRATVVTRLNVE